MRCSIQGKYQKLTIMLAAALCSQLTDERICFQPQSRKGQEPKTFLGTRSVGNNRLTNRLIVIQNLIENRLILARLIDTINFLQYLLKMLQISTKIPK